MIKTAHNGSHGHIGLCPSQKFPWCVNEATHMRHPIYIFALSGKYPPLYNQHILLNFRYPYNIWLPNYRLCEKVHPLMDHLYIGVCVGREIVFSQPFIL